VQCPVCKNETNPTLVYCQNCGAPTTADVTDIIADDEKKLAERKRIQSMRDAKGLLFTGLALFITVLLLRIVLVKERHDDHRTSFRVPYSVLEQANVDPPVALPSAARPIPIPEYDFNDPK
jgi:hypothetical protein